MALYIKYRPKTFDQLVKQEHIVNILKPKIANNDYAHNNFIFYGPRGTGKTSTARIFAKAINCLNPKDGNPCNECDNCNVINTGKTLDIVEIDAASHTQVDNIREEIIDKAPYPPSFLKKKVYIIDEVHMLSKSSFNALLKIMEEPPEYLVFILATTEIHKIPETILSRCQVFVFKKVPVEDLVKHMKMICDAEKFRYQDEALLSIAKISDGCVRDAIKYVDQVSILGDITQQHVSDFLGVASNSLLEGFMQACLQRDVKAAFGYVTQLQESGVDMSNFIKQCFLYIEEHFQENPSGYVVIADMLKSVSYGLRTFPIPTMLLKMEIYKAIADSNDPIIEDEPDNIVTKDISKKIVKQEDFKEKKDESVVPQAATGARTGREVLDAVIQNPDIKQSTKSILTGSCVLELAEDGGILYVFNKLQGAILQKPENWSVIEDVFKKEAGVENGLQIVFTTKEEYLAQKL